MSCSARWMTPMAGTPARTIARRCAKTRCGLGKRWKTVARARSGGWKNLRSSSGRLRDDLCSERGTFLFGQLMGIARAMHVNALARTLDGRVDYLEPQMCRNINGD